MGRKLNRDFVLGGTVDAEWPAVLKRRQQRAQAVAERKQRKADLVGIIWRSYWERMERICRAMQS